MRWSECALILLLITSGCGNGSSADGDAGYDAGSDAGGDAGHDAGLPDGSSGTDQHNQDEYCPVVDYEPCGGDVVGTWEFRALCPEDPEAAAATCEHPFSEEPVCSGTGNQALCDDDYSGILDLNADLSLEVYTILYRIVTWTFTDECLAAAVTEGTTAEQRCLSMETDQMTCLYEDGCTCVTDRLLIEEATNIDTYAVTGNEIALGEDPPSTYCIEGDIMTMDYYLWHPVTWRYWILERE